MNGIICRHHHRNGLYCNNSIHYRVYSTIINVMTISSPKITHYVLWHSCDSINELCHTFLIKHKPSAHQKCFTLLLASVITCKANSSKCHNCKVKWHKFLINKSHLFWTGYSLISHKSMKFLALQILLLMRQIVFT